MNLPEITLEQLHEHDDIDSMDWQPKTLRNMLAAIVGFVAIVGLFLGYAYIQMTQPLWGATAPAPTTPLDVSQRQLLVDIIAITRTTTPRTGNNPTSLRQAGAYIKKRWRSMGYHVHSQPFVVKGQTYENIEVSWGPKHAPRVIVGAHYDVYKHQMGADDNGSGIAGLLALSQLAATRKPSLSYRIDFVAFALEEPPYFGTEQMGSAFHAKAHQVANHRIKAMLSLDMIGYFTDAPKSQRFTSFLAEWFYPNKGNFIAIVSNQTHQGETLAKHMKKYMRAASTLPVYSLNSSRMLGADFSDHRNYWTYHKPAAMITDTAFLRNKHYHKASDTPDTLNLPKMKEVIRGLYWAITHF